MGNSFDRCRLDRSIIQISGLDQVTFLQGLVSCDITKARHDQAVYGAFLTPKGKFLHDFFCIHTSDSPDGRLLIDIRRDRAGDLLKRFAPFRLRSKIEMTIRDDLIVVAADHPQQVEGWCFMDPRLPDGLAGWRLIMENTEEKNWADHDHSYQIWRISTGLPEATIDLIPDDTNLIEGNLDYLSGIDWQKGCYMGQEVTARTHYRGLVKRRLMVCSADTIPPTGSILYFQDREAGDVRSTSADRFMVMFRLDLATAHPSGITVSAQTPDYIGEISLRWALPEWQRAAIRLDASS